MIEKEPDRVSRPPSFSLLAAGEKPASSSRSVFETNAPKTAACDPK